LTRERRAEPYACAGVGMAVVTFAGSCNITGISKDRLTLSSNLVFQTQGVRAGQNQIRTASCGFLERLKIVQFGGGRHTEVHAGCPMQGLRVVLRDCPYNEVSEGSTTGSAVTAPPCSLIWRLSRSVTKRRRA